MERAKRVARVWSYLATFRFVAEQQHVTRAAQQLGTSASAVSRSIRDLEALLKYRLFTRQGRRIELNADGHRLLKVVRDAMRRVYDGISPSDASLAGELHILSDEPFLSLSVPALLSELHARHPGLVPVVRRAASADSEALLLRGVVDVAFGRPRTRPSPVTSIEIAQLATGLYVRRDHELASARRIQPGLEIGCVDMPSGEMLALLAGTGLRPQARVVAEDFLVAMTLCRTMTLAAVLPRCLVETSPEVEAWVRLGVRTPKLSICALTRGSLGATPRVDVVVEIARRLGAALGPPV